MIKGVVWYYDSADKDRAMKEFEWLYQHYTSPIARIILESEHHPPFVEFKNGDIWEVKSVTSTSRARCNISYISTNIPSDLVVSIISPLTSKEPYQGMKLY